MKTVSCIIRIAIAVAAVSAFIAVLFSAKEELESAE